MGFYANLEYTKIAPDIVSCKFFSVYIFIPFFLLRYALLLGAPPFETDSLKQTYARITSNSFTVPPCVSAQAKDLIVRLLHPDPKTRPNLDAILKHDFFAKS